MHMIRTLPELARVWWTLEDTWPEVSSARQLLCRPLVPAYKVNPSWPGEKRVQAAACAVRILADRLARLPRVWAEWDVFDAEAYFDLYPEQARVLVTLHQTRHKVQVMLFADLLVPGFREAELYWVEKVVPALHAAQPALFSRDGHPDDASHAWAEWVAREVGPEMEARLYAAAAEIRHVREVLYEQGDVGFLAASASLEERYRVSRLGNGRVDVRLWQRLQMVPTLTLELTFMPGVREEILRRRALRRWRHRPWHRSHAR